MLLTPYVPALGGLAGFLLVSLLLVGLTSPRWRIWPAPPSRSANSFAFWTLFRTLNMCVLVNAASALAARFDAGLPLSAQLAALAALLAFAVYACALFALGRSSTYCSASGLNTRGIYQWTRNPQYTAAILAYTLLALAAPTPAGIAMTALLCATYALMAFAEEPWLSTAYGSAYAAYAARVPRFVNVARGQRLILVLLRQLARTPQRWATLRTKKAAAT